MTLTGLIGVENRPLSAPAAPWTPADLGTALRIWLKADTGTSLTGSSIDAIADQSGSGIGDAVSLTTHRPTLLATGHNGLPTIDFDSSADQYLSFVDETAFPANGPLPFAMGAASSWFFVGQMDGATDSYGRIFAYLGGTDFVSAPGATEDFSAPGSVCAVLRNGTTDALCMYQLALAAGASGSVPLGTNMRVLMIFDGTNATLRVNTTGTYNDTPIATSACSFTLSSAGILMIGGNLSTAGGVLAFPITCFDGRIAEALVTNTALNSTERANLDAYVVARLGV